jgi:hypothetical protein
MGGHILIEEIEVKESPKRKPLIACPVPPDSERG